MTTKQAPVVLTRRQVPELDEYEALKIEEAKIAAKLEVLGDKIKARILALPGYSEDVTYKVNGILQASCNVTNSLDLGEVLKVLKKPEEERTWFPIAVKFTPSDKDLCAEYGLLVQKRSALVLRYTNKGHKDAAVAKALK